MRPDQQHGEAERSVDVLCTMQLSHNSAHITAKEHPRSEALAEHAADTKLAMDAVAEYIAANDEYDAAYKKWLSWGRPGSGKAFSQYRAAATRRALAHARMKGKVE